MPARAGRCRSGWQLPRRCGGRGSGTSRRPAPRRPSPAACCFPARCTSCWQRGRRETSASGYHSEERPEAIIRNKKHDILGICIPYFTCKISNKNTQYAVFLFTILASDHTASRSQITQRVNQITWRVEAGWSITWPLETYHMAGETSDAVSHDAVFIRWWDEVSRCD